MQLQEKETDYIVPKKKNSDYKKGDTYFLCDGTSSDCVYR